MFWVLGALKMLTLLAKRQVGKRNGRIEPRAVKRRPKAYPLLMVPRAQTRQAVMLNGHPKKIKQAIFINT
jgi:hypothetical protein